MGLMAQKFKDLDKLAKLHLNGVLTTEQTKVQVSIAKEVRCLMQLHLEILIANGKPSVIENRMHDANILSKGEFVQIAENIEFEMVMCPDQDKTISREMCLSFSGDEKNNANCSSCKNYKITRQLLLPKK